MRDLQPVTAAERQALYEYLWAGPMFTQWHWLQWNFDQHRTRGDESDFARLTLDALIRCDRAMEGFAKVMLDRLSGLGGEDHNQADYESIKQWLSELLVIHHLVTWSWPEGADFVHEPSNLRHGPNPEVVVDVEGMRLGAEVKTPNLRAFYEARDENPTQLLARLTSTSAEAAKTFGGGEAVTFPRDNPIKDFLHGADTKFAAFRERDAHYYAVLFIVWSDWINEPISALLSPASGLLTVNSFDRVADARRSYPNIDAIVLLRHQHEFHRGMANRPPAGERSDLDYGSVGRFPPNALIAVPEGRTLPNLLLDSLAGGPSESPSRCRICTVGTAHVDLGNRGGPTASRAAR